MWRTLLLLAFLAAACGGDTPTSPSPVTTQPPAGPPTVASLAGTWTGRITGAFPDGGANYPISLTIQQSGSQITGIWQDNGVGGRWFGEISGTLSGFGTTTTFEGTATWNLESDAPGVICVSRSVVSGPASPPTFTWTGQEVRFSNCEGVMTNVRWTLVRAN